MNIQLCHFAITEINYILYYKQCKNSIISHFYNYVGGVRPPDKRKGYYPLCSDKNRQDVMSFGASE